ncbi:MAG: hypothetical protein LBE25_12805 [Arthrobacter sp.]|jgi:hypothetical protein|nr:hypothetical protein [Arthrobacter sp.]
MEAPTLLRWDYNAEAQTLRLEGDRTHDSELAIHAQQLGRTTLVPESPSENWEIELDRVPPGQLDIYLTSTRGEQNAGAKSTLLLENVPDTTTFSAHQCTPTATCLQGTGTAGAIVTVSSSTDSDLGNATVAENGDWIVQLALLDPVKTPVLSASLRTDPADTPLERDVPITPAVLERTVGFLNRSTVKFQGLPGQRIEIVDASTLKPIPHLLPLRTTLDPAGIGTISLPLYVLDERQFVVRYLDATGNTSSTGAYFTKNTVPVR